jgi:hypothetical protein
LGEQADSYGSTVPVRDTAVTEEARYGRTQAFRHAAGDTPNQMIQDWQRHGFQGPAATSVPQRSAESFKVMYENKN